jgi:2'-5' RNA ligase
MAISAFVVHVPEVEACVGRLRERFDATTSLGVPAHITVLAPFMSPERITDAVLCEAQAAIAQSRSFAFTLAKVARFPTTTYLAPESPEPFVRLTEALVRRFRRSLHLPASSPQSSRISLSLTGALLKQRSRQRNSLSQCSVMVQ